MSMVTHDPASDRGPSPRPGVGDESHDLYVVGYVHRSERTRLDCKQPLRVVCRDDGCRHEEFWRCDCRSEEKCPDCAERNRRLLARIVHLGVADRAHRGYTYFATVSAPGTGPHRRWVQVGGSSAVKSLPRDRPECECWRDLERLDKGLAEWNKQESACWNRLRLGLSRLIDDDWAYIGAVEVQDGSRRTDKIGRQALHRHIVIHSSRPLLAHEVGDLARAAGYGCVHDLQLLTSPEQVAWYISKYVTKSATKRGEVPWWSTVKVVDRRTGEVTVEGPMFTKATYRTWSASRSWGYTLKGLKDVMKVEARARARYLADLGDLVATRDGVEDAVSGTGVTAGDSGDRSPP